MNINMREIDCKVITQEIVKLCQEACLSLPQDVLTSLRQAYETEESVYGKNSLDMVLKNAKIAAREYMPVCQDTGMAVVFVELGQEVHITGGLLYDAIQQGVREAYVPFRKSVLTPLGRKNTGDNTPAVIHFTLTAGDKLILSVAPKGFGSENMSALAMLKPSQGIEGVEQFIVDTVSKAGANPCPPVVVGVGIGGTMEKAALMAKHSLLRKIDEPAADEELAQLEAKLLERINRLGIGPQGLGGRVTALAVHIESHPTHLAGLPVAVNMQCHCARHTTITL